MSKPSKRHHYLPQSYQNGFAGEDGLVSLFDRETKTFRRQQPLNTALETHFYTVTDKEGRKSDGLERVFAGLDGVGSRVISRRDAGQFEWENAEQRTSFAIFIAFLYCRTPAFDKEQTALAEQMYRAFMKADNATADVTAKLWEERAKQDGEEFDMEAVKAFFEMVQEDNYAVDWVFVFAPPGLAFITSDAPFFIAPPPGMENDSRAYGILTPGAAATIPLSSRTCLIMEGQGGTERHGKISKDGARRINENIAKNSDRFIIGRDQIYLERLVKRTRVGQFRWTSRFEFNIGEIDGDLLFHTKRARPPSD
jgi:hypothetical protein